MTYDGDNRLSTSTDVNGVVLTYSYDPFGNVTQLQDSFGGTVNSTYDKDNELTSRSFSGTSSQQLLFTLAYDSDGRLTSQVRYADTAGTTEIGSALYTYDNASRLTGITDFGPGTSTATLAGFAYTYDNADRLVTEVDNGVTTTYGYDATNQLTSATGQATQSYDANGNRNNANYSTTAGNELVTDGTWNYTYDGEGNEISKVGTTTGTAAGLAWSYGYDLNNQMTSATETSSGTVVVALTFKYDVFGNRVEEDTTSGGTTTVQKFAYDASGNSWADLSSSGSLTTRRVDLDGLDQLAAQVTTSGVSWFLTDHLGSVRGVVNSSGSVTDTITYDPYGKITSETNPGATNHYYTGTVYDQPTGLYYDRARYYDPTTSRWISQDPLGLTAGPNSYQYTGNSPTNATDPSGMAPVLRWDPWKQDWVKADEKTSQGVNAAANIPQTIAQNGPNITSPPKYSQPLRGTPTTTWWANTTFYWDQSAGVWYEKPYVPKNFSGGKAAPKAGSYIGDEQSVAGLTPTMLEAYRSGTVTSRTLFININNVDEWKLFYQGLRDGVGEAGMADAKMLVELALMDAPTLLKHLEEFAGTLKALGSDKRSVSARAERFLEATRHVILMEKEEYLKAGPYLKGKKVGTVFYLVVQMAAMEELGAAAQAAKREEMTAALIKQGLSKAEAERMVARAEAALKDPKIVQEGIQPKPGNAQPAPGELFRDPKRTQLEPPRQGPLPTAQWKAKGALENPGQYLKQLGKDALGNGYPGPKMYGFDTHAHHIVMQEGLGQAGRAASEEARAILSKYGIDPFKGVENLVWAPNSGYLRSDPYAEKVLAIIKKAPQNKQGITKALRDIADIVSKNKPLP